MQKIASEGRNPVVDDKTLINVIELKGKIDDDNNNNNTWEGARNGFGGKNETWFPGWKG